MRQGLAITNDGRVGNLDFSLIEKHLPNIGVGSAFGTKNNNGFTITMDLFASGLNRNKLLSKAFQGFLSFKSR